MSDSDSFETSLIPSHKRTRQIFESSDEENAREPNAKKRFFGEPSESSINDDGNMKSP